VESIVNKSPDAFRTISEVADELDLPQHVLRFWETRFNQIKPMKRGGGRRYYRPDDVELLSTIKALLYNEGYTIRGVQRLLKEQGARNVDVAGNNERVLQSTEVVSERAQEDDLDREIKSAVNVEEFAKQQTPKKGKSILNRLSTYVSGDEEDETGAPLAAGELKHLQSTLHELLECKRLLDQTRQG